VPGIFYTLVVEMMEAALGVLPNWESIQFEITKHVSLYQLNPLAIFELREQGTCEFELQEILFDLDCSLLVC
jgi:Tc toxin complex TcA C-terminal TcB-binding domain